MNRRDALSALALTPLASANRGNPPSVISSSACGGSSVAKARTRRPASNHGQVVLVILHYEFGRFCGFPDFDT
jgi:hypothetical protein